MSEEDIDLRRYAGDIADLLERFRSPNDVVLYVEDITEWYRHHAPQFADDATDRAAKTLYRSPPSLPLILLREHITSDIVASVVGGLLARGFVEAQRFYEDERGFVTHLVLHEIAHALDRERSEEECDRWAFEKMGSAV